MGMTNKCFRGAMALAVVLATGSGLARAEIFDLGGDISFGDDNDVTLDIAGLRVQADPGRPQYNRMVTSGSLVFGGLLHVALAFDFKPESGNRFDLFDWGSSSGSFARIDYTRTTLNPGLSWHASSLYTTGDLVVAGVAQVPEPGSVALLLAGVGLLGLKLRRQRGHRDFSEVAAVCSAFASSPFPSAAGQARSRPPSPGAWR